MVKAAANHHSETSVTPTYGNETGDQAETLPALPNPEEAPRFQVLEPDLALTRTYPYSGAVVMVSDDPEKPGVAAIWYTTRRRGGHRWRIWRGWADPVTHNPITIDPICWRPPVDWAEWNRPQP